MVYQVQLQNNRLHLNIMIHKDKDMETLSVLLVLREGNPLHTDGFPPQRASNADFDVSVDVSLKTTEQTAELQVIKDAMRHIVTSL